MKSCLVFIPSGIFQYPCLVSYGTFRFVLLIVTQSFRYFKHGISAVNVKTV